jgi:photosystem II stability/assembly factor-like uncharacterized protein
MRGNAFMSHDLGVTFTKAELPGPIALFGATVDEDGAIVLVGENNAVLKSTDNGATFKSVFDGERKRFVAILPEGKKGWLLAGEGGVALKQPTHATGGPS